MTSSKVFSGTGNPNGVVTGKAGDLFQDRAGGALWVRTSLPAPDVWQRVLVEPVATPTSARLLFSGGLEVNLSGGGGPMIMPYAPGREIVGSLTGPPASVSGFFIGFGSSSSDAIGRVDSPKADNWAWVATRVGTLTSLRVNVPFITAGASADFNILKSAACNGPFATALSIVGVTAPGCYNTAGAVAVAPGDRIVFQARITA